MSDSSELCIGFRSKCHIRQNSLYWFQVEVSNSSELSVLVLGRSVKLVRTACVCFRSKCQIHQNSGFFGGCCFCVCVVVVVFCVFIGGGGGGGGSKCQIRQNSWCWFWVEVTKLLSRQTRVCREKVVLVAAPANDRRRA